MVFQKEFSQSLHYLDSIEHYQQNLSGQDSINYKAKISMILLSIYWFLNLIIMNMLITPEIPQWSFDYGFLNELDIE